MERNRVGGAKRGWGSRRNPLKAGACPEYRLHLLEKPLNWQEQKNICVCRVNTIIKKDILSKFKFRRWRMKRNAFKKRLVLTKNTIANLSDAKMAEARGGSFQLPITDPTFPSNDAYCPNTGLTCPACDSNVSCHIDRCISSQTSTFQV